VHDDDVISQKQSGALFGDRFPVSGWRTRFAPAPTGYLHLGHLVNAMHVWGLARRYGGVVVLRVEDHDLTRCRPEYEEALLEDLEWLGFEPDEASVASFRAGATPYRQSDNGDAYRDALASLEAAQRVYACTCSRRDILRAVGPVAEGDEPRYPGTCRDARHQSDTTRARRVVLADERVSFNDIRLGVQQQTPANDCGDVLVRDRFGHWTYQFAVTVDDRDQQIDVVVRGEDLLSSTGRQILIARALGRSLPPTFFHHTLLRNPDGRKLSKAAHDTSLRELRAAGASASQLIGEAAFRCQLQTTPAPLAAADVVRLF
jgi:glutamyl-tRNA synthetase/glutamyl-Q tRNA(Asp) synthetase